MFKDKTLKRKKKERKKKKKKIVTNAEVKVLFE